MYRHVGAWQVINAIKFKHFGEHHVGISILATVEPGSAKVEALMAKVIYPYYTLLTEFLQALKICVSNILSLLSCFCKKGHHRQPLLGNMVTFSATLGLMAFILQGKEEQPFVELLERKGGQNRTGRPLFYFSLWKQSI